MTSFRKCRAAAPMRPRPVRPARAVPVPARPGGRIALGVIVAVLVPLAGCSVGPDFHRPSLFSPASWFAGSPRPAADAQSSLPVPEPVQPDWWRIMGDPQLTSLEERVAAQNLDVRVATLRVAESRAQLRITGADRFATVNGTASYKRDQLSEKLVQRGLSGGLGGFTGSGSSGGAGSIGDLIGGAGLGSIRVPPVDLWSDGIDANYEIDLWGRVRREVEGARAQIENSAEGRRDTLLSVVAEVARDYVQLRGQQALLGIQQENLRTDQDSLRLTQQRAAGGLGTDLDVAQAASQVAAAQAQIPYLEQQATQTINAISLLEGQAPGALQAEFATPGPVPPVPPRVPVGVPSELALRRPDIRQAEAALHAATAQVGVAIADFYPKVTLSANVTFTALQFRDLGFGNDAGYTFGPNISIPIFQGGRLRGQLQLARVDQQEAAVSYQRTVLSAWHDVDNALVAYAAEQARRDALVRSVAQNQRALALSRDRYQQGLSDFLNVLTAERSLLAAQQDLTNSTIMVTQNMVQLYKALGGGWETAFPAAPPAPSQQASAHP